MSYEQASSRRDHLTLTTKDGKIELTEEQLDRVTGGADAAGHIIKAMGNTKWNDIELKRGIDMDKGG